MGLESPHLCKTSGPKASIKDAMYKETSSTQSFHFHCCFFSSHLLTAGVSATRVPVQLRCGVRAASRSRKATIGRVPARRRQGTRAGQALGDLQAQRRGDLKERGSEGALGSDGQEAGLARNPSGHGPQATTGAGQQWPGGLQEGAGAARPRRQTGHRLQSRRQPDGSVGRGQVVVSLVARRVGHSAARLDVGARVCLALMTCEGGNNSGIDCELGSMPKQEPLRDNLDAPFIGDGHIGVHLGEADVASDPRPGFSAHTRDGVLKEHLWTGHRGRMVGVGV